MKFTSTTHEVAKHFSVDPQTVRKWRNDQKIQSIKKEGRIYYNIASFTGQLRKKENKSNRRCCSCSFWSPAKDKLEWGTCILTETVKGSVLQDTEAYAITSDGDACLLTNQKYGCNQWESFETYGRVREERGIDE